MGSDSAEISGSKLKGVAREKEPDNFHCFLVSPLGGETGVPECQKKEWEGRGFQRPVKGRPARLTGRKVTRLKKAAKGTVV